ncbi:MAG: aldo/keto reductase [Acholeplasmatales bacterium]|nr:MAG: aldo/keto reductase [Acholeplasmatales bacterium]
MKTMHQTYTLSNGVKMPKIGFGTWQIAAGESAYESVRDALRAGYRHIDTAAAYQNEESVGKAIRDSGLPREEIFVTSKLPSHIKTYDGALEAFEQTMSAIGLEYLDLYLIHAPWPWHDIGSDHRAGNVEAFKALETIYREGRSRSIGVSNFSPEDLDNILAHCKTVPHVNQIAFFIGKNQAETQAYCQRHNILVQAYSPLALGYALSNELIGKMAEKYTVTPAQICVRYCIQKGTAPLPKTTRYERMVENAAVDFTIDDADMAQLDAVEEDPRRWG